MKAFLAKLFVFSLFLGAVLLGLLLLMYFNERTAYYRNLTLSTDDRYIAVGDSRSEQILSPALIPGMKNLSLSGSQMYIWKTRMSDFVKRNRDGIDRTFVIEVAPFQLQGVRSRILRPCDRCKAFFWLLHPELQRDAPFGLAAWEFLINEFPQQFLCWVASLVTKSEFRCAYRGCYAAPRERSCYDAAELLAMAEDDYQKTKDFNLEEADFDFLDELHKIVEGANWKLMVVTFPMFGHHGHPCMRRFVSDLSAWCKRKSVAYIDLTPLCPETEYWLDSGHLNRRGAEVVCKGFAAEVANIENK